MIAKNRILIVLIVAVVFISFIPAQASAAKTYTVRLQGFQFSPQQITIAVGDTVEWINDDAAIHEVTIQGAPGGSSPDLAQTDSWSYLFDTPGIYKYRCIYHSPNFDSGMVGIVIVDGDAPLITNVSHNPIYPTHTEAVTVNATVTDPSGVDTVTVRHCYWLGTLPGLCSYVDMNFAGGDLWTKDIGPYPFAATSVDYVIIANDTVDNEVLEQDAVMHWFPLVNYIETSTILEPAQSYIGNKVWVNGTGFYGFSNSSGNFPNSTLPAQYSQVNVSIKGTPSYWLGQVDPSGNYSIPITMPLVPNTYTINVTITNRSIAGYDETDILVQPLTISHSPALSTTVSYPLQSIWVNGTAMYNNGSAAILSNLTVGILENSSMEWYGTTDGTGKYSIEISAPGSAGNYNVTVAVSNLSLGVSNTVNAGLLVTDVPIPDIVVTSGDISLSNASPIVNEEFTIFIDVHNSGTLETSLFQVDVYIDGQMVYSEVISSIAPGDARTLNFSWLSVVQGSYTLLVQSDAADSVQEALENNNDASRLIFVDGDNDDDGIGDSTDPDDDNDGFLDGDDKFPKDPSEWLDADNDGKGDNLDRDDDNDGYFDWDDMFPKDPLRWLDSDRDGIHDGADDDDDNDGVADFIDAFPLDPKEWSDNDGDGLGDFVDWDDDNDGLPDVWELIYDLYPDNPDDVQLDNDGDGLSNLEEYAKGTNPKDKDSDDDGVWDLEDFNPTSAVVSVDPEDEFLEAITLSGLLAVSIATLLMILMITTKEE
jgi:plastocyanin